MTTFTRLLPFVLLSFLLANCADFDENKTASYSQATTNITLATAIPVVHSMVEALTEGTIIDTFYLPSERHTIKRVPGWLKRQNIKDLPVVDIVIDINSVWPTINLYPYLRDNNILVIPIDAAQALIPNGETVAIALTKNESTPYFWLNPSNTLLMLGIIYRDLVVILESDRYEYVGTENQIDILQANFKSISQSLRKAQLDIDQLIVELDVIQVAIDKDDLSPLSDATLLPIITLQESIKDTLPSLLITNKKTSHQSLENLPEHIVLWTVDDFSKKGEGNFIERWESNIVNLEKNTL